MAQLHEHLTARKLAGLRPAGQHAGLFRIGRTIEDHIARRFEIVAVDLHIARDLQTNAALGPAPV